MSKKPRTPNLNLREYYLSLEKKERLKLAKKCDTTDRFIQQIYLGNSTCSPKLAVELDKNSNRAIKMHQLNDDVDWDYVMSVAPAIAENV